MKPLQRYKQYKNCAPQDTIATILGILKEKLGITTYERAFQERNGLFHSCRIILDNGDWLRSVNVGTNGKGMTVDYSRASAYGEMMERLQNFNVLMRYHYFGTRHFLEKHKDQYPQFYEKIMEVDAALPYLYAYDEEVDASNERLKTSIEKFVCSADNEQLFTLTKDKEHFYVPYYDVSRNEVVSLPFDIIYNSISTNGLCAGNTPKEAIIEGLSEIFERYVIRKIYFDNLSLPRIPREYFEGNDILNRLEELEQKEHYNIEIVDCSLGVGIPAVGVVIITENGKEYQFHMGVDPSPITALERSLTELFQGRDAIKFKQFDDAFQQSLDNDISLKEAEMHKTNSASTGHYPKAFFGTTPSYEFKSFNEKLGYSDDSDLKLMTELIEKMGFHLYVRDNSFLGFPAYSIYIPGMSELHNSHSLHYFEATYGKYEPVFLKSHHLRTINRQDEADLLKSLEASPDNLAILNFVNKNDVWEKSPYYLFSILKYRSGNRFEASTYMELFADETFPKQGLDYSWSIYNALSSIMENDANRWRNSFMGYWHFASYIIEEIETEDFFVKHKLPEECGDFSNCFDCEDCPFKDTCNYIPYLRLAKRLCQHAQDAAINQYKLSEVFK